MPGMEGRVTTTLWLCVLEWKKFWNSDLVTLRHYGCRIIYVPPARNVITDLRFLTEGIIVECAVRWCAMTAHLIVLIFLRRLDLCVSVIPV